MTHSLPVVSEQGWGTCCPGCPRQEYAYEKPGLPPNRFVPPTGVGSSGVMLVGDSPWIEEVSSRPPRPFAGASGALLDRMLRRIDGMTRDQFIVTNGGLWCRPPHLGWTDHPERCPDSVAAMTQCTPHLDNLIEQTRPRAFVALGGVALQRLAGVTGIEANAGYVLPTPWGVPVVPTYHPSYILQGNQKLQAPAMFAIRRALELAAGTATICQDTLLLDPSPGDLLSYLANLPAAIPELVVDIETPESANLDEEEVEESGVSFTIIRAGFSAEAGVGVTFPFTPPYIEILQGVLDRAALMVEHADNHFDSRRLRAHGLRLPARIASSLWAFHFLQSDLRKGLGACAPFFACCRPWKHLSDGEPALYNALDQVRARDVWTGCRERLMREGRWRAFERHVIEVEPTLTMMGRAGIVRDPIARDSLKEYLDGEYTRIVTDIQQEIPDSLRPPKQKEGLKRVPREVQTYLDDARGAGLTDDGALLGVREDLGYVQREFLVKGDDGVPAPVLRWCKLEPFNPRSSPQVASLIKLKGLKMPVNRREDRETTEAKHLKRFARKFPVFRKVLDARQVGTYATLQLIAMPANADGRIVTTYGWHPSTWRKSSRNANLQVIPKRADLSARFRQMFTASPGHVLIEVDSAAIEAVLVGWFAGSARYIALAKAGVHDWLTSCAAHDPVPLSLLTEDPERFRKHVKRFKVTHHDLRERCKRVVHMSNYLATPGRMYEEYPEDFETEREARDLQNLYFETEPGKDVRRWQREVCDRAHRETRLDNPFGYRHYFYDVYTFDYARFKRALTAGMTREAAQHEGWKHGDDAKRAVAFLPQSTASAIQTEILLALAPVPEVRPHLRLIIHDSIVAEVPEERAAEVAQTMYDEFTRGWPELGGLAIGAEVKMGRNLGPAGAGNGGGMTDWMPLSRVMAAGGGQ